LFGALFRALKPITTLRARSLLAELKWPVQSTLDEVHSQASNCVKNGFFGSLHCHSMCNGVLKPQYKEKWTAFDWPSIMVDPGGSI
jgi:hypothetical protein